MTGYASIWEFTVKSARVAEFVEHYDSNGSWVQLFRQGGGYRETLLLQDRIEPLRFITIDRWEDVGAYAAFRSDFVREYTDLDRRCEGLTEAERHLGDFAQ